MQPSGGPSSIPEATSAGGEEGPEEGSPRQGPHPRGRGPRQRQRTRQPPQRAQEPGDGAAIEEQVPTSERERSLRPIVPRQRRHRATIEEEAEEPTEPSPQRRRVEPEAAHPPTARASGSPTSGTIAQAPIHPGEEAAAALRPAGQPPVETPTPSGEAKEVAGPSSPPRPKSAFFYYLEEFKEKWRAEHPRATPQVKTLSQLASVSWRALTDEQRQPYQAATSAAKQAYREYQQAERERLALEQAALKTSEVPQGGASPSLASRGAAVARPSRLSARAAAAAAAAAGTAAAPTLQTPQVARGGRRAFTSPPTPRIGAPISTPPSEQEREALSVDMGPVPPPPRLELPSSRTGEPSLGISPIASGTPTSAAGLGTPRTESAGPIPIFRGRVLYTEGPHAETEVSVGSRPFSAGSARATRGTGAPGGSGAPTPGGRVSLVGRGGTVSPFQPYIREEAGTPSTSIGPASALLRYLQSMEVGPPGRGPAGVEELAAPPPARSEQGATWEPRPEEGAAAEEESAGQRYAGPTSTALPPPGGAAAPHAPGLPPSPLQLLLAAHAHIAAESAAAAAEVSEEEGAGSVAVPTGTAEELSTLQLQVSATGSRATIPEQGMAQGPGTTGDGDQAEATSAPSSSSSERVGGVGQSSLARSQ